jgi:4-amino-4-deoxy-L-arabinose transferase-like glycosyltransferase
MWFKKETLLLLCILMLGGLLRFVGLSHLPGGFHGDEAAYGYNAYALWRTGADEYGENFPLTLKSFEDYKPALYAYLAIPSIALLGVTESATRFPSTLFGTLTIYLLYIVTKRIFSNNNHVGLIAAFLLAISPWHIVFSRTTSEVTVSLFFILVFFLSLLKLKDAHKPLFVFSAIAAGTLAIMTYTASRMFVPIVAVITFFSSVRFAGKKLSYSTPIFLVSLFIASISFAYLQLSADNRFSQVSIFHNPNTKLILEEQIREDEFMPTAITRMFHNKAINYARTIIANYSTYFSLDFLALEGGFPQRQRIPNVGLFYLWQIIFLLAGVFFILSSRNKNGYTLLALWIMLLLPTAITFDDVPNVYRSIVILPILIMIISLGITEGFAVLRSNYGKRMVILASIALLVVGTYEGLYFFHQYSGHGEKHQPWHRDFAMKGLVSAINTHHESFDTVYVTKTKTSYIHFLFYNKIDPLLYRASGSNMDKDNTGFAKYLFIPSECPLYADEYNMTIDGKANVLYVNTGTCPIPKDAEELMVVYWQDGNPAYRLIKYTGETN